MVSVTGAATMTTTLNRYLLILLILTALITLTLGYHRLLRGLTEWKVAKVEVTL